ncbi:MAG: hypothetical protein HC831_01495 [Chloroflexia bacterium]|nr:hypothetical protein [Chloroflexia bacterium]
MNNLLKLGIFALAITLFSSCKKEKIYTDSERIEIALKSAIEKNKITICDIYLAEDGDWDLRHDNVAFEISNGFIIVKENNIWDRTTEFRYNLLYMTEFLVSDTYDEGMTLRLFFINK